jgi:hypothetical protein
MMAEAALVKAEDLEVLARKSLVADSARLKVAISRRVGEIVARLEDPSVPVRSAAQGLGALTPILKLLYRWHEEPSLEEMKHADHPLHNMINLELINTPPEKLRELAEAKRSTQNGSRETVHNGQGDGTLAKQAEGPRAGGDGQAGHKKEDPTLTTSQTKPAPMSTSTCTSSSAGNVSDGGPSSSKPTSTSPSSCRSSSSPSQAHQLEVPLAPNPVPNVPFGAPAPEVEQRRLAELGRLRREWRGR